MSTLAPTMAMGPLAAHAPRTRTEELPAVSAAGQRLPQMYAAVVGTDDPQVCSLLTDVLRDINLEVRPTVEESAPDVVLAMVDRINGVRAVTEARAAHRGVPLVAILPLGTHRLATRAIAAGAQACYMMDMPIDRLRGLLLALLRDAPATSKKKGARSGR
jgi:hypothetical protein